MKKETNTAKIRVVLGEKIQFSCAIIYLGKHITSGRPFSRDDFNKDTNTHTHTWNWVVSDFLESRSPVKIPLQQR